MNRSAQKDSVPFRTPYELDVDSLINVTDESSKGQSLQSCLAHLTSAFLEHVSISGRNSRHQLGVRLESWWRSGRSGDSHLFV